MEKFSRTLRGYDPDEVNAFIDKIIEQVEAMVNEIKDKNSELKEKNEKLKSLETLERDYLELKDRQVQFDRMEDTLKRAILMAEKTSEQIKLTAYQERDIIVGDAKKNANRIVNEALLKSENIDKEAETLKRNVTIFKRRLKEIIESQLELVDDIEKIDM